MKSGSQNNAHTRLSAAPAERSQCSLDRDFLRLHFGGFPDPVLATDATRKIVFLNQAAQDLMGHPPNAESGLLSERVLQSRIVGGRGCFVEQCLGGAEFKGVPVQIRNPEGQWVTVSVTATLVKDSVGDILGCIAIMRDIQVDHLAHSNVQSVIAMRNSIIDNFPTPFFTVGTNLIITSMNSPMESLTGFTKEEAIGRLTCAQVLSTTECNTDGCLLKQAMETGLPVAGVRRVITDRSGRRVPVVVSASIITDSNQQIVGGFESFRDITSKVEAEQKIKLLTELTQEGILMVDESCRIVFANFKMTEMSGLPMEQLVGKEIGQILNPDQQSVIADLLQKVDCDTRLSFCSMLEPFGMASDGYRAFETCVGVTCIGKSHLACLYFRDLTERIQAERELRNANNFLHNIIQGSVDGIIVVDTTGNVLIFNEGAERILGYSADEVIGHPEVFRKFYNSGIAKDNMRKMRSNNYGPPGKLTTIRLSMTAKSGELIPVDFSASIIKEGEQEIASVGIFSDQREHLKICTQLEEARIQLLQSEKIASLGRLAAGVAHEINNPLAGILIYSEMLLRDVKHNPQWRQDLQEIIDQTMRCKQIVIRLLEFSRQPLGHRISFEVNELLDRSVALLGNLFQDIDFELRHQPDLPPVVGDSGQIQQVFINIITNAAYAMNGKGRLIISSSFERDAGGVVLTFTDTGPGIPPEIADKIFEPFFTTKRPGEGTGLGLSVAYGIIQQHGGEIQAGNRPGGGAEFIIILPLERSESTVEMIEE
ncbi:putative Histidine kinase [Syntrophobacter sp. SbD1]|nr:putative Histidine kinase [Syntrophobacter sp. SbD1]